MPLVIPKKTIERLSQAQDIKSEIFSALGDIRGVEPMYSSVLVAVYIRPEQTKGGIYRAVETLAEDIWQGKAGLVVKLGPMAFTDDAINKFHGERVSVGDWVAFKIGDSWQLEINSVPCRLVEDTNIRLRLHDPEVIF